MALAVGPVLFDDANTGAKKDAGRSRSQEFTNMAAVAELVRATESRATDFIVAHLEGVYKNYGNIQALRDVNFRVRAGEVLALLGPNGAGKTTAVKLLLGLLQPDSGKV